MKLFLLLLLLFSTHHSRAQESTQQENFELKRGLFTLGNLNQFPGYYQEDSSGSVRNFEINPYLGMGLEFTLPRSWYLVPELGFTLPKTSDDDAITMTMFFIRADAAYRVLKGRLKLLIGTSLVASMYKGNGGTTTLGNAGQSTEFSRPEQTRTSYNNTFDLGAEFHFNRTWSTRLQAITYQLFDSDERKVSYTVSMNFYWENKASKW